MYARIHTHTRSFKEAPSVTYFVTSLDKRITNAHVTTEWEMRLMEWVWKPCQIYFTEWKKWVKYKKVDKNSLYKEYINYPLECTCEECCEECFPWGVLVFKNFALIRANHQKVLLSFNWAKHPYHAKFNTQCCTLGLHDYLVTYLVILHKLKGNCQKILEHTPVFKIYKIWPLLRSHCLGSCTSQLQLLLGLNDHAILWYRS